jgi:superfamily I DNA/RNA helicase
MASPAVIPNTAPATVVPTTPETRRRVVLGPPGAPDPFPSVARAVTLAIARRRFALVVPTKPALEHAKNEVARLAGAVDPMSFFTILGLAKRLLGSACPRLASPRQRDFLLERALGDAPPGATAEQERCWAELRGARRFRGFRRGLLGLFSEVEALGIEPRAFAGTLRRSAPTPHGRAVHARIAEAYRAYRAALARAGLAVESDLLARATRAVERGHAALPRFDVLLVDGFTDLAPRQIELLAAVSARIEETEVHWPRGRASDSDEPRRALVAGGFALESAPARAAAVRAPAIEHVVASLFVAGTPREGARQDGLSLVRAGSPGDEAIAAVRIARSAVLDRGHAWNDVLVIVPDVRAARAPIERAAALAGVPVRVHAPRPLLESAAVRGALAFVRAAVPAAEQRLDVVSLLEALAVPAVGLEAAPAEAFAHEVRRRAPGSVEALAQLGRAGEPGARAFVHEVLELARGLAAPGLLDGARATNLIRRSLARRLRRPVLRDLPLAVSETDIDAAADEVAALAALDGLLAEMEPLLEGEALTGEALVTRLAAEAGETEYTPRDRRRRVVHVVDLIEARSWRTKIAIVSGLAEGSFPRPWKSDVLLDESARRAFGTASQKGLGTGEDHLERERQLFLQAVSCALEELHLVHAGFDGHGEPQPPSPFLAAIEELFAPDTLARIKRSPADVVAQTTADVETLADARRFAFLRTAASFRPGSEQEARARRGAALFERLVALPEEAEHVRRAVSRPTWRLEAGPGFPALERVYSASELETYAACGYKHFVQHVLNARRREDLAVSGLDARLQGKIVHRALERAVLTKEAPEVAFEAAFAEIARGLPLGPDEESFRRSARAAVAKFLVEDDPEFLARTGLVASQVEVAFGDEAPLGPLLVHDPALGGQIRLEGRIDRVDDGPRGAIVTDYKLGKDELDPKMREAMARGEKLQLQVYLLALEGVLGKTPLGASLVALRSGRRTGIVRADARELGQGARGFALNPCDLDRLLRDAEDAIRRIVREIARGRIDPQPRNPKDCRRCDVRDVCRFRERPQVAPRAPEAAV